MNSNTTSENTNTTNSETDLYNQRKAHPSRSEKYSVVTTIDVIEQFEKAGFEWKKGPKQKVRKNSSYAGYETHVILFQHPDIVLGDEQLKSEIHPLVRFSNSYSGLTALQFDLGLNMYAGLTGLVLGRVFKHFKRKHIGLEEGEVAEIVKTLMIDYRDGVTRFIKALKERMMTRAEMLAFAEVIVKERFRNTPGFITAQYDLLLPECDIASVWDVLLSIQENMALNYRKVDSSVYYTTEVVGKDNKPERKQRKIRRLSDLREVTHLNKFLFDIALKDYISHFTLEEAKEEKAA